MITYNDKKYKIVVVTPAGRKRYMELLLKYILKQKNIIDEYRIWVNTTDQDDIRWFEELKLKHDGFITLEYLPKEIVAYGNTTIYKFFENTIDIDTIYIRFDDDIVWMEDNFIEKLVKFRIDNPQYFLIFGNIINNAVIDYIHQKNGVTYSKQITNECLCKVGWENPIICEEKHNKFIQNLNNNNIEQYKFDRYETSEQRISINCICWFGKEFNNFSGKVGESEEPWLSEVAPTERRKKICVCGTALCSHYSFWVQREYMDKTEILLKYKQISENIK
jgi:hypothetical protein